MRLNELPIPEFKKYFPSVADMDREQRAFYEEWLAEWQKGNPVRVDGNVSYLYCYLYTVLSRQPKDIIEELRRFKAAFCSEPGIADYCSLWISDCYVVLGDYRTALDEVSRPQLGGRASSLTDSILSLRLLVNEDVDGDSLLTLAGPQVTPFGQKHLSEVSSYLNIQLAARKANGGTSLLSDWARDSHRYPYFVFSGSFRSTGLTNISAYSFSLNDRAITFAAAATREAENTVREEYGLPHVGEGWVSEAELFYSLKTAFPDLEVVQHARLPWLGPQHIDIFLPSVGVAIEFQGLQHDQPVEYFGGEVAFEAARRRDSLKRARCARNGVRLIEVRPGYDITLIESQIREIIGKSGPQAGSVLNMESRVPESK
jgi:hypothetical protein